MKKFKYSIFVTCCVLTLSCATAPKELVDARSTFAHASEGPATHFAPEEMRKAKAALADAELSFTNDPKSFRTRDLAYVAQRKTQMAEVRAAINSSRKSNQVASNDFERTQGDALSRTKDELGRNKLALSQMQTKLASLAAVKEESRGLVILLSGSVLFPTNKSTLLPSAQSRLNHISEALLTNKQKLIVEGHTDSKGSSSYNIDLSKRRADAVRSQLISSGYPADLIEAKGIGDARPVASNSTAEDRANNRRVEIIVVPEDT